jgi:hypothetical protein
MVITYDPDKRLKTLRERGLDFEEAAEMFAGSVYRFEDSRRDYGERRIIGIGWLRGRMVAVGYVQRGETRHVFSMRKCNAREIKLYTPLLQQAG